MVQEHVADPLVIANFESMCPVILTPHREPMSDEEFAEFCSGYPDCMVEVSAEGEILIMPPAYSRTGQQNARIGSALLVWADASGKGSVFDSSSGFRLPNGARRSPDASYVLQSRIDALPQREKDGFFGLCPDFVIELRSTHDRVATLKAKMREYVANGAQLGWLIDPVQRQVWIYRPGREAELLIDPTEVRGEGPVDGFVLSLGRIFQR